MRETPLNPAVTKTLTKPLSSPRPELKHAKQVVAGEARVRDTQEAHLQAAKRVEEEKAEKDELARELAQVNSR